ncbi:carboxypeptidase-like regulatory domain-containing protein [Geothermobacter hydrogeniphilus]|uniref:carboxypeptidase-like regulatory domain-containing protein n=1 Tax=Geothermobacter hydrogeniphilus TaxID=1969733 RepID=UPI00111C18D9|nr:carboxypeptidase-like regulatory domain-containing protein [Geothermobacter hydrogeniphilus]
MSFLKSFQIAILVTVLISTVGCTSYEPKTYEGKVVDEQGNPISGAAVRVCYIGWGFGDNGGVVWDKVYCSDPATTDEHGTYKIEFAAPASAVLRAEKDKWHQSKSFMPNNNRVVLVKWNDYIRRNKERQRAIERTFRRKTADENGIDYYCRVVRKRSSKIELIIGGKRVKIFQTLLIQEKPLFGVSGPYDTVELMAKEIILRKEEPSGEEATDFAALPKNISCDDKIYFIQTKSRNYPHFLDIMDKVEVHIPSAHAAFALDVWRTSKYD